MSVNTGLPPVAVSSGDTSVLLAATAERRLSLAEQLANSSVFRRTVMLVLLCLAWEGYARYLGNSLILPTFTETLTAFWEGVNGGPLLSRIGVSLQVLCVGYAAGVALAGLFTGLAVTTRAGSDLLSTLTAMFNPLPAVALLPLALLWFGLGMPSLVFVIIHSVLWTVSLNALTGFQGVPDVQRMAGQNYGLRGLRFVSLILVPAAFPSILAGLKIGWAFAWRTLIAAEMVFGVAARSGGLGWFIYENRAQLETASVFAGLMTVILIGLTVENVVFRTIELHTVRKWGMQK